MISNSRFNNNPYVFYKENNRKWTRVSITNILFIDSNGKFNSRIVLNDSQVIESQYSLLKILSSLPVRFERVNKTSIVNMDSVAHIDVMKKTIFLQNNQQLKFGLTYYDNIKKYLVGKN